MDALKKPSIALSEVVGPARSRQVKTNSFDTKALLDRLDRLHERMPMTDPVVESMRRDARY